MSDAASGVLEEAAPAELCASPIRRGPRVEPEVLVKAGIFYAENDRSIAERLFPAIQRAGFETELCDFQTAGISKIGIIEEFLKLKDVLFWIATPTSLHNNDIMKAISHIGLHTSITSGGKRGIFVVLKPHEHLNARLSDALNAYTPLCEDDMFESRLENTLQHHKRKLSSRTVPCALQDGADNVQVPPTADMN